MAPSGRPTSDPIQRDGLILDAALAAAVEHYPFGIALLDGHGKLLTVNPQAAQLLGRGRLAGGVPAGETCCQLFGCRTAGGPPNGRCLTELALESGGWLSEMRIDIGPHRDVPVWVSTAPAGAGISISLRPGTRGDRRRHDRPHWANAEHLRIQTFGSLRVRSGGSAVTGSWLDHRSGRLLKYLIARRHAPTHAEQIVADLWPKSGREAMGTLRQCVHALRSNLEPGRARHGGSTFIVARNGGYYLDRDRVWVDADEFEQRAATGLSAAGSGDGQAALSALTAALELYTGDFLGDEPYAEWAFAERDRLRDLAGQVMRTTSEIYRASGELDAAMSQLQRLAAADPYDVDVQRQLIGLYLIAGRRSQAVRRYQRLHHQMLTEFGEKLDFELSDLSAEALAQDRPSRRHQSRP